MSGSRCKALARAWLEAHGEAIERRHGAIHAGGFVTFYSSPWRALKRSLRRTTVADLAAAFARADRLTRQRKARQTRRKEAAACAHSDA